MTSATRRPEAGVAAASAAPASADRVGHMQWLEAALLAPRCEGAADRRISRRTRRVFDRRPQRLRRGRTGQAQRKRHQRERSSRPLCARRSAEWAVSRLAPEGPRPPGNRSDASKRLIFGRGLDHLFKSRSRRPRPQTFKIIERRSSQEKTVSFIQRKIFKPRRRRRASPGLPPACAAQTLHRGPLMGLLMLVGVNPDKADPSRRITLHRACQEVGNERRVASGVVCA